MRNHKLEKSNSAKYLGATVASNLSWSIHIDSITSKAFGKLTFLQRNIAHCPRNTKTLADQSLIRPKLEYSVGIWDLHTLPAHTVKDINKVESVQQKAARFVTSDYGQKSSVTKMLSDLEWPSLQQRRKDLKLTLFYKAYYNHVDIDIPLQKNPRGMPHKFMLPSSRTNIHLHSTGTLQ